MGLFDIFSTFCPTVYAEEEPADDVVEDSPTEEEEEEEEEEPEDPKEAIMEGIEEFFHFMHCADECAAPKIFATTK
ncbi:unnamed protein product [Absidia cylindrospora]